MKKALIVWGGWDGHEPGPCAEVMAPVLREAGFEVELSTTLDSFLDKEKMAGLDLIVPIWTMGTMTGEQEQGLVDAVAAGTGIAGFHGGMCDAFRANTNYQFMTGGQFVAHPDNQIEYEVKIARPEDPIMAGLKDFKVTSEQYYMHVDPTNEVLATTTFHSQNAPWISGCVMPVVWKRTWGQGKVFYSSLGHVAQEFSVPEMLEIQKRGMIWAAR
jgi:hypothetical protein